MVCVCVCVCVLSETVITESPISVEQPHEGFISTIHVVSRQQTGSVRSIRLTIKLFSFQSLITRVSHTQESVSVWLQDATANEKKTDENVYKYSVLVFQRLEQKQTNGFKTNVYSNRTQPQHAFWAFVPSCHPAGGLAPKAHPHWHNSPWDRLAAKRHVQARPTPRTEKAVACQTRIPSR